MDMHDRDGGVFVPEDQSEPGDSDATEPYTYAMDDYGSYEPLPIKHAVSGTQLRHRLITPEAMAAITAEVPKLSLMERLAKRFLSRR